MTAELTVEKTAEKTVKNYTPEQTKVLVEAYTAEPTTATIEAMAAKLGKTTRSVVAKLSKEGVYKSKTKEPAKREMLKSEMVAEIAKYVERNEEVLESLEKATGTALMAVLSALRVLKEEALKE
jgi:putative heme iron utilization protein